MNVQVEIGRQDDQTGFASDLAKRLNLELVEASVCWSVNTIRLRYQDGVLFALTVDKSGSEMAISADFLETSSARRRRQAQGELLVKAVQGRQREPLNILDATAGMAADAMLMAAMGHQVLALERSPLVFELVSDGLVRAAQAQVVPLPELQCAEAVAWMSRNVERQFDVIYLDPMFAETSKNSLPRKNMQLLRRLAELETDNEGLLALAKSRARLRVVVKRPAKGDWLNERPNYSIKGQRVRFDIYTVC